MLRSINELQGNALHATDGDIGNVEEFFFDDQSWTVRYLVADTGGWLTDRQVLLSPAVVRGIDWETKGVQVGITREQVKNSPDISTHMPISRQSEAELSNYYGYQPYWDGVALWGTGLYPYAPTGLAMPPIPPAPAAHELAREADQLARPEGDPHLRSTREVRGYHIHASDGELGHVSDFLIDEETWQIRYLVLDTRNWWPGKHVLIAPKWIDSINWESASVSVKVAKDTIQHAPEYDPAALTREYEAALHRHYDQPAYWEERKQ